MDKGLRFAMLVQTEILFEVMKGRTSVSPGAVVSMAMEVPLHALDDNPQELYSQALELVAWFYGGADPWWMPEDLLYEEIVEEVYTFEDGDYDEDDG
ncbi:MAG: hypothetical protein AB7S38_20585 [Vulcanimicrobiota bacterium]